jgi:hypothetical protein
MFALWSTLRFRPAGTCNECVGWWCDVFQVELFWRSCCQSVQIDCLLLEQVVSRSLVTTGCCLLLSARFGHVFGLPSLSVELLNGPIVSALPEAFKLLSTPRHPYSN